MKSQAYPDSICDISENDFWSHIRIPKKGNGVEHLEAAVRMGLAGRRAAAFRKLAEFHRVAMADVWARLCERETGSDLDFDRTKGAAHGAATTRVGCSNFSVRSKARGKSTGLTPLVAGQALSLPRQRRGELPRKSGLDAENVLKLKITGWAGITVQFKGTIDWNHDFGERGQYGFHYLTWLDPAVRRFIERGEKRYRDFLIRIVDSYYKARNSLEWRTPGLHPVYYELGAYAKAKLFIPLYLGLINTGDLEPRMVEAFVKLFLGFGRSLRNLQRSFRPGNWQVVGCSTLFQLARVFPEFSEAQTWKRVARKYLLEHLKKGFFSDGGHCERCWGYGFMSLNGFLSMYNLAQYRGGLDKDRAFFLHKIRKAFRWYAKTLGPNALKPGFGDCSIGSAKHILAAGQRYFPKGTGPDLGVDRSASYFLKPSGFAIMRNGNEPTSAYLNISFGRWAGYHSHMDTLSLNFWAEGQPLIEEVNRFSSYDHPLNLVFRAPESHNQVTIDGMHYDNSDLDNRKGRDVVWHSTAEIDYFSAYHTAYRGHGAETQSINARVRRTVVFVKNPGYAIIFDSVSDEAHNKWTPVCSITQNWHSPFPFRTLAPTLARTKGKACPPSQAALGSRRAACLLAFAHPEGLQSLDTGIDFIRDDVASKGKWPARYFLRARRWMPIGHHGPVGFATLLYPFTGAPAFAGLRLGTQPRVSIKPLKAKGSSIFRAEVFEVKTPRGTDVIVLNPEQRKGLVWNRKTIRGRLAFEKRTPKRPQRGRTS